MINTPITRRAKEIAESVFAGKTDVTGYPYMRMRVAVAEQMEDEYTTAIALLMDVYDYSELTAFSLMKEGMPMRVAYALSRLKQREGEPHWSYIVRLIEDDELVYPVAQAAAAYLGNLENYKEFTVEAIAERAHYALRYRFLKQYHDDKDL